MKCITYLRIVCALCLFIVGEFDCLGNNVRQEEICAVQDDPEKILRLIQLQFKTNAVNKYKVDLKADKLIITNSDGIRHEYDLNVVQEIKAEYDSGKYFLSLSVHSNSTLLERDMVNIIYGYDSKGTLVERAVYIGMPFKTYQSAVTTRDLIRKLKKVIES